MLDIRVIGRLGRQGLTEIFFESAEPSFDELDPEDFFRRFPEGRYKIEGETLEGDKLRSRAQLTHLLPAPAGNITVNGNAIMEPDEDGLCPAPVTVSGDVTIAWDPVTTSHPTIGNDDDIEIIRYQVVAEWEDEATEEVFVSSNELPAPDPVPPRMSVTIPSGFFMPETEFKVEVLAREESYNQTAVESCPFEYE